MAKKAAKKIVKKAVKKLASKKASPKKAAPKKKAAAKKVDEKKIKYWALVEFMKKGTDKWVKVNLVFNEPITQAEMLDFANSFVVKKMKGQLISIDKYIYDCWINEIIHQIDNIKPEMGRYLPFGSAINEDGIYEDILRLNPQLKVK